MGIKDSKLVNLSYEEALKRVSDAEQKKLREAFKRSSTLNGHMSKVCFIKDVLGEAVPVNVAERLYEKFGGSSKGISLKDLMCGLVLVTRGKEEEKLKFLFGFYSSEPYQFIDKSEMDEIVLKTDGNIVEELAELFKDSDQVSYDGFKTWMKNNASCLNMSTWLLRESFLSTSASDQQTPTFYQTLAGITHLDEADVVDLEKHYWQLKSISKNGKFDLETFSSIVSPPLSAFLCEGLFRSFDENQDDHVDLKELACGISACCRGPTVDQFKFCFKLFDSRRVGLLQRSDVKQMIREMMDVRMTTKSPEDMANDGLNDRTEEEICRSLLSSSEGGCGEFVTQGEYLIWALEHPLTTSFLSFLIQVCHVCLGLRPRNKREEAAILLPWLAREEREGQKLGQVWYLVSMAWWRTWSDYTRACNDAATQEVNASSSKQSSASALAPRLENDGISLLSYQRTGCGPNLPKSSTPFYSAASEGDAHNFSSLPPSFKGMTVTSIESNASQYNTLPRKSPSNLTMTSSLHGESSSSTPSGSPMSSRRVLVAQRPAGVDNSSLVLPPSKVASLTNEGGLLKKDFIPKWKRDFEIVSEAVWRVFSVWYGKPLVALPRTVIEPFSGAAPTLELYPLQVKLLRTQTNTQRLNHPAVSAGLSSGLSGLGVAGSSYLNNSDSPPTRYLAYTACFSCKHTLRYVHTFISAKLKINKEDIRLWDVKDEINSCLLEEEEKTLEQLKIFDNHQMLIEVRNKDLTWPEEILKMAKNKALVDKSQTEKGATGLNNLGNTCFMNSALQCLSNTKILTAYFNNGKHLYELNRTNPLGARGHLAEKYGHLVKDLWSGQVRSIAPVKLKWTINKYAPCFNDFQQHDSQELLAFVLDRLHEDLNRVQDKPYVELKDSDGRPDEIVAHEAWENHFVRNQSIVVDLFHGQLKSQVRCLQCDHTSVKFDPFTFLSLPLPLESCIHLEVIAISTDASCPIKFGLKLNGDDSFSTLKSLLSRLSGVPVEQLLVVEIYGSLIKGFPQDENKIKLQPGCQLFAYQLPPNYPIAAAYQRFNMLSAPYPSTTLTLLPPMTSSSRSSSSSSIKCNSGVARQTLHCASECPSAPTTGNPEAVKSENNFHFSPGGDNVAGRGGVTFHQNGSSHQYHHHHHFVSTTPICLSKIQRLPQQQNARGSASPLAPSTNGFSDDEGRRSSNGEAGKNLRCRDRSSVENLRGHVMNGYLDFDFYSNPVLVVAVHRKMIPADYYFLWFQRLRASLFGTPLVLACHQFTTHQDLYQQVWGLISRLVSPLPPSDSTALNHAQDCDDSLKYEFPFVLKVVQKDGMNCVWCPWYRFCKGCPIECNSQVFNYASCYLAIDWEPTALHLRYHGSQEKVFVEHESLETNKKLSVEPIGLDACLRTFTKEERLEEKELYYCSKCKKHGHAVKKLELWSLPPILIIHLKRFQLFNNYWVKSQKIVQFPTKNFDPSGYLVQKIHPSSPPATIFTTSFSTLPPSTVSLSSSSSSSAGQASSSADNNVEATRNDLPQTRNGSVGGKMDPDNNDNTYVRPSTSCSANDPITFTNMTSTTTNIVCRDVTVDSEDSESADLMKRFHAQDHSNILYDLYAVSCHSGILGCGHYTTYAKNPNGKWYYYNDSSCKEITEDQVDTNSAYMLFYERKGLDADLFLSSVTTNKDCDTVESDEEIDKELKKMCTLQ